MRNRLFVTAAIAVTLVLASPSALAINWVETGAPEVETGEIEIPGWRLGGSRISWEWGLVTQGPQASVAFATGIDSNYNSLECSFLESDTVAIEPGTSPARLHFRSWHRIEDSFGEARDAGAVLVSGNGGVSWTLLPTALNTHTQRASIQGCLGAFGIAPNALVVSGRAMAWQTIEADLSSVVTGSDYRVRFVFASDNTIQLEGWYVRDVTLAGKTLLP